MCPVLGLGQYVKGCLHGACWRVPTHPGQVWGAKLPTWSGPAQLYCSWPQDPCVALLMGTPCHPDPRQVPGLTHCPSHSPTPALSTQRIPSLSFCCVQPRCSLCREQDPCRVSVQDLAARCAVSAEHALGSAPLSVQHAGALHGTAVPLLGQLGLCLSFGEVRVALLHNLLPYGPWKSPQHWSLGSAAASQGGLMVMWAHASGW